MAQHERQPSTQLSHLTNGRKDTAAKRAGTIGSEERLKSSASCLLMRIGGVVCGSSLGPLEIVWQRTGEQGYDPISEGARD